MNPKFIMAVVAFAVGALITALFTYGVKRIATRRGFFDHPGGRKGHSRPVVLGGGVAIVAGTILPIIGMLLVVQLIQARGVTWIPDFITVHFGGMIAKTPMAMGIAAAVLVMCVLGLIDDVRPLGAGIKFLIQCGVALWLVVGLDLRIFSHFGWWMSVVLSVLWIVTLTNSLNFLDNMDGLAAGVGMIVAAVFGITSLLAGQIFVPAWCWLLAGSLGGFLLYNFHPASIYMGDAGSTVIGMLLAVLTILTTFFDPARGQHPVGIIAPLVVMAVPLYDTASVFLLRLRSGAPLWTGDRRHFSHRLIRRGLSVRKAVLVIWLATLVTGLPALLLPRASWELAWGIVLQTLLVVSLVALLESGGDSTDRPSGG